MPAVSRIQPRPLGVVLVIAPWNYPLQLSLAPAVAAIAAGNAVVIKPSEHAPATARKLAEVLPSALPPGLLDVVEGGPDIAQQLIASRFDHILFTGQIKYIIGNLESDPRHLAESPQSTSLLLPGS